MCYTVFVLVPVKVSQTLIALLAPLLVSLALTVRCIVVSNRSKQVLRCPQRSHSAALRALRLLLLLLLLSVTAVAIVTVTEVTAMVTRQLQFRPSVLALAQLLLLLPLLLLLLLPVVAPLVLV
jgi:hypothetical protein